MIRETSLQAFRDVLPTLGSRHRAVLEAFLSTGRDFTNKELARFLGWEINTVTPRVNELVKMKLLCEAGKRFCSISNRLVYSWKLSSVPMPPQTNISPSSEPSPTEAPRPMRSDPTRTGVPPTMSVEEVTTRVRNSELPPETKRALERAEQKGLFPLELLPPDQKPRQDYGA